MAQSQEQKQAFALLDLYVVCYIDKYKRKPSINRYRDKWGFIDMVDDLGIDQSKKVIEYYFKVTSPGHSLNNLFVKYDKLSATLNEKEKDRAERERLRQITKKRVEAMNEHRTEGS